MATALSFGLLLLAVGCVSAASSTHDSMPTRDHDRRPVQGNQQGGMHSASRTFSQKLQALRKLATLEEQVTHKIIERLDELNDIELAQLHIPKRALAARQLSQAGAPAYGGTSRRHALQAGVYGEGVRRQVLQAPGYGGRRQVLQAGTYPGRRSIMAYP